MTFEFSLTFDYLIPAAVEVKLTYIECKLMAIFRRTESNN